MTINQLTHKPRHQLQLGVTLLVFLALSGCATTPSGQQEQPVAFEPTASRGDGSVRGDTEDQKVAQLWASAEQARETDRDAIALKLIYEALEIAPQNPLLWSRAAEIQLDGLQAELAESYATKSNAFSLENKNLQYRNWLIIKQAREMRGDLLGARSAHKKVQEFQY